jgi:Bacterial protein of unknown function (DUF899)
MRAYESAPGAATSERSQTTGSPPAGSCWQRKEFTRQRDALNAECRRLPMVDIDKDRPHRTRWQEDWEQPPRRSRCQHYPGRHLQALSGCPFTHCERGLPKAERPEEDRDEVLNPAMEQRHITRCCRQMGRRGIGEDTDHNVYHDQQPSRAEKSSEKGHLSSPPLCRRRLP